MMGKPKEKGSAKSGGKSKKLDFITAEVTSVRAELKKLVKQQSEIMRELEKLVRSKSEAKAAARPARKPAAKPATKAAKGSETPSRPVLVQNGDQATPAAR